MPPDNDAIDDAVGDFLGKRPRAEELADLRAALQRRVETMKADLARAQDPAERAQIEKDLATAARNIEVLSREEMITEFVEESVRATASWSLLHPDEE